MSGNGHDTSDPIAAVRQATAQPRTKRFFAQAASEAREGLHVLVLDGRPARTPAKKPLAVASAALAQALAEEWDAQREWIDPAAMPLTRIINSAIDGVDAAREAVIDEIAKYAGSDLVCYRAEDPETLVAAQCEAWDPLIDFARRELGAELKVTRGILHVPQDEKTLAAIRSRTARIASAPGLAALHVLTTLSGSAVIALAVASNAITVEAAWSAAHVDEHHQERLWGEDEEALRRRALREADFRAAALVLALSER